MRFFEHVYQISLVCKKLAYLLSYQYHHHSIVVKLYADQIIRKRHTIKMAKIANLDNFTVLIWTSIKKCMVINNISHEEVIISVSFTNI